jgi:hypothetical protein
VWSEPSPSDFERWEALVSEGATPHDAARECGFNGSSTFRRADPVRHAELMAWWRDVRDATNQAYVRDKLRVNAEQAMNGEPYRGEVANRALELLGKTAGLFTERTVEVTGANGGPIEIERREVSLHGVLNILAEAGALDDVDFGALAGSRPVLPAHAE